MYITLLVFADCRGCVRAPSLAAALLVYVCDFLALLLRSVACVCFEKL